MPRDSILKEITDCRGIKCSLRIQVTAPHKGRIGREVYPDTLGKHKSRKRKTKDVALLCGRQLYLPRSSCEAEQLAALLERQGVNATGKFDAAKRGK